MGANDAQSPRLVAGITVRSEPMLASTVKVIQYCPKTCESNLEFAFTAILPALDVDRGRRSTCTSWSTWLWFLLASWLHEVVCIVLEQFLLACWRCASFELFLVSVGDKMLLAVFWLAR